MKTIEKQILIKAAPNKVWGILTDFSRMASWNPFIRAISGSAAPGGRLSVTIAPPGRSAMTFYPLVLVATPDRELRWLGTVVSRWIFAGEHYFLLDRTSDGATRLTHGERFTGLLAPLIMRARMLAATEEGFGAMNEALKRESE
jgi:hypothetical protein